MAKKADGRNTRVVSRRHPAFKGRPKGVYYPDLVGVVRGYPKTLEKWLERQALMRQQIKLYNAEGITGRTGVPDGWAGKKRLIKQINDDALAEAKVVVDKLIQAKAFEPDNEEARVAVDAAMQIILAEKHTPETEPVPLYNADTRLKAIKTVLDVVQTRPGQKGSDGATKAEDFLAVLAKISKDK